MIKMCVKQIKSVTNFKYMKNITELSEPKLESVIDNLPICVAVFDSPIKETTTINHLLLAKANSLFKKTFLIDQKLTIGRRIDEIFKYIVLEILNKKIFKENRFEFIINTRINNGNFQIKVIYTNSDLTLYLTPNASQAEIDAEVAVKKDQYNKLFEKSIIPVIIVDKNLNIIDSNSEFQEHFFHSKGTKNFKQFFKNKLSFEKLKKELQTNRNVESKEVILLNKQKKPITVLISFFEIIDDNQKRIYQGIVKDITKEKDLRSQLLKTERLSTTGKLARSIAHEIRNPLTNISLSLEQLEELIETIPETKDYINILKRNTLRIDTLITDLLESSKPKDLKLEKYSINQILEETLLATEDRMQLREIKLVKKFKNNLPPINVDKDYIKIAFLNLILNAIEAITHSNGTITIETLKKNEKIIAKIKDNGSGIPKKELEKLFDAFYTNKKDGMGLGLTTVQNIINTHKADIAVKSIKDKGTEFSIYFDTAFH